MVTKSNASAASTVVSSINNTADLGSGNESNTEGSNAGSIDAAASDTANVAPRPSGIAPAGTRKLAPPLPHRPSDFEECHELTAPQRAAILPEAVFVPTNLDIPYATKVAIGTAARLVPYRDQIAERFSDDLAEIDMIDTYARSTSHSDAVYAITTAPPERVQAVYEEALEARRLLHSDISNLVTLGLISSKVLADVNNEAGHMNTATDIQKLVAIGKKSPEATRARMGTTVEQRSEYKRLAYELTELTSHRDTGKLSTEEARNDLNRATTLLVRSYAVAERVMSYILWDKGTFRTVVPSLYNNRPKARKGNGAPEVINPAPEAPPAADASDVLVDLGDAEPIVPGARGGSPFAPKP